MPKKIGLTGGIACGKSTVLEYLESAGLSVCDCDSIVRDLYQNDSEIKNQLRGLWGDSVFDSRGCVNAQKLAAIVFDDDAKLAELEALVHPRVRAVWQGKLKAHPERTWVVEIPLLFEKKLEKIFDVTICVSASLQTQLARLRQRGLDSDSALKRIEKQMSLKQKEVKSDILISNNGSTEFLLKQVKRILSILEH